MVGYGPAVFSGTADVTRPARPEQVAAEHVDARCSLYDTAVVADPAAAIEHRQLQPGVVRVIAGCPDDSLDTTATQIDGQRRVGRHCRRLCSMWSVELVDLRTDRPLVEPVEQAIQLEVGQPTGVGKATREKGDSVAHGSKPTDNFHAELSERGEIDRATFGRPDELRRRDVPGPDEVI